MFLLDTIQVHWHMADHAESGGIKNDRLWQYHHGAAVASFRSLRELIGDGGGAQSRRGYKSEKGLDARAVQTCAQSSFFRQKAETQLGYHARPSRKPRRHDERIGAVERV